MAGLLSRLGQRPPRGGVGALVQRFVPATEAVDGLESAIATVCGNTLRVQA